MADAAIHLDESLLDSIQDLSLTARHLVNGFLQGQHRSALRGVSQEFMAYRPYLPGDALKDVDWNVWARSDHYFIRQFRHESNFRGYLVLDASKSMDFGDGTRNKFTYGRLLAACLASLMLAQMDAPGLAVLGLEGGVKWLPPSTRADHLDQLFHQLGTTRADGRTAGLGDISSMAEDLRRRSLAVWITDGFFDPEEGRDLLTQLRLREMDVLVFHLMHREEMEPQYDGEVLLTDSETGEEMIVDGAQLRRDYAPRLAAFLQEIEGLCTGLEAHYCRIITDEPLDEALHRYLALREQL
ncbi:DUF58 domain-containing protein [Luteolibacter flavescens]|uniref:DUF58 domain-containing protein n=1 Tax=Luteolibacter flavescens TaxID=1859460 RepID=A0ABT3FRW9_9BACT|nr:DUF58 domain-containing protein [Luteolibacter flavescens]MCW1886320.1 DUF58 domain-containing protein [Luteolibacter flavescens]